MARLSSPDTDATAIEGDTTRYGDPGLLYQRQNRGTLSITSAASMVPCTSRVFAVSQGDRGIHLHQGLAGQC
jgi:hypothetical protein